MMVEHSLLSSEFISSSVEDSFGLGTISSCRLRGSQLNDVYSLETDSGNYIARVSPASITTQQDPAYELALLGELEARDAEISAPIRTNQGSLYTEVKAPEGDRILCVFRSAGGRYIQMNVPDYAKLGTSLARLHRACLDLQLTVEGRELDLKCLMDRPLELLRPFAGQSWYGFRTIAEDVRNGLERAPADELRWGICHGDAWANINIDEDGSATYFDFEYCGPGWIAYDVAMAKWGVDFEKQSMSIWEAFLSAYCEGNPLTQTEVRLLPSFVLLYDFWSLGNLVMNADRWGDRALTPDYFGSRHDRMVRLAADMGTADRR